MNRLIIPICVEAFLTNGKTTDSKQVPVVSPNYKAVSYNSLLGSKNTPSAFSCTVPLRAGAHLHFILPDALTRGGENGYPAVPNRFLVTRLVTGADLSGRSGIDAKAFMVESDFMSMDSAYSASITIPKFDEEDLRTNWRYLGRNYSTDSVPPKSGKDEYLGKLTAVGAGDPMFAAYYPSCASVFGFYDDMKGVPLNTSVTYFVMGYYSDPANDPLNGISEREGFSRRLAELNLSVEEQGLVCGGCVFFGQVSGVVWKGRDAEYPMPKNGEIDVSAGYTSAEAISAAIVRGIQGESIPERFLTALQYDLADIENLPDGHYTTDDEIHLRQFRRMDANEQSFELSIPVKDDENTAKDAELGKCFSGLRAACAELGRMKRLLEYQRAKLFYSWEQYMVCYEDPRHTPKDAPSKEEMLAEILRICDVQIVKTKEDISAQTRKVERFRADLEKAASGAATIVAVAAEPFYLPNDPVLLMSGAGVKRTYAFGEDGRFTTDGTLMCQQEVVSANLKQADVLGCVTGKPADIMPEYYDKLLYQAVLLSSDTVPIIEELLGKVSVTAHIPSDIAVNRYNGAFITLFMEWETDYRRTGTGSRPDDTLSGWRFGADETTYHYEGTIVPEQADRFLVSGRIVLTPHAVIGLSNAMKKWLEEHHDDPEAAKIAEKIKGLGVVSQNLDGFTHALTGLVPAYQFPVMGAGGDDHAVKKVAENISPERVSFIPESALFPLRGGYLGVSRLSLIGTFGQAQYVAESSYFGKTKIRFAETLEQYSDSFARTFPAFTTPARLNFDFVSAADEQVLSSSAPETSPICGIILPELLNRRLMIYGADGGYVGSVNTAYRDNVPCARWVSAARPGQSFEETHIKDKQLRGFLSGMLSVDGALADTLALIEQYLCEKLIPHGNNLIWGRPFVLARGRISFELMGGAAFKKSASSFGKYDTHDTEMISFPVFFGGMRRTADGIAGYFSESTGYSGMIPAHGAEIKTTGKYLLPQDKLRISANGQEGMVTLLMESHASVKIQTGLIPVKTVSIHATHANAADNIQAAAEMNPVIAGEDIVQLPVSGYMWRFNGTDSYVDKPVAVPTAGFDESVVMDGFLVKGEADANGD